MKAKFPISNFSVIRFLAPFEMTILDSFRSATNCFYGIFKRWREPLSVIAHAIYVLNRGKTMPKIKTNRAAAKRFKKTGTGKFVFSKSNASHILTKKTTKRKRGLRKSRLISKPDRKEIKLLLPNG